MTNNLPRRWADEHQYDAEPQLNIDEDRGVMPSVTLLHMTDDPLGVLAAQNGIYKGKVKRSLSDVTDDERRQALDDMMKTTLESPLEAIKMHWLVEGVDRAMTHQMVRNRTGNYGQESLRFAVMGDLLDATSLPPDLQGTDRSDHDPATFQPSFHEMLEAEGFAYLSERQRKRAVWDWTIRQIDMAYHFLVENGMAAEEARGLLPHCTATRLHYQLDMRALKKVMGERLCTQAQFHWKVVAVLMRDAIRTYVPDFSWAPTDLVNEYRDIWDSVNRWQFELLADSGIFRPVCYQTNKCMFQASADRGCTIRERVEQNVSIGRKSDEWERPYVSVDNKVIESIYPMEWALNPGAARRTS